MFAPKLTTDTSPELPFRLEGRFSAPDSVKSSVYDTSASNNVKNVLQSCFHIQLVWYTLIANSLFICNRHHARSLRIGRRMFGRPFSLLFRWREATTENKSAFAGYHPRFFLLNFCNFWGSWPLPRSRSVQIREKSGRAVKKRAGEKQWEEWRGEHEGILTNITVHQPPRPLPEKPFFVSKWQEFKCQNAPSRRDRESSYSVTSHPHVLIWVGTGSIFFVHQGERTGVVDTGGGEGYWYLISRGWHIMTS